MRDAAADRLMGLVLAEEAQDYPAIEAMVISSVPAPESPLLKLPEAVQEHIGKAFELINASPALRLTKVNEFLGGVATDPDRAGLTLEEGAEALLEWCRTEFAKQKGKVRNPKEDTNGKKAPDAKVASPAPDPPARETPTAAAGPRKVHRDPPQPKAVAKPEPFVVPSDLEF